MKITLFYNTARPVSQRIKPLLEGWRHGLARGEGEHITPHTCPRSQEGGARGGRRSQLAGEVLPEGRAAGEGQRQAGGRSGRREMGGKHAVAITPSC